MAGECPEIILADDEPMFQMIIADAVTKAGVPEDKIHTVDDGSDALETLDQLLPKAEQGIPILMLLDNMMPCMNGEDCARQVSEEVEAGTRKYKPYMVCFSADLRKVLDVKDEDGKGFFQTAMEKNFEPSEFAEVVEKCKKWWASRYG
uniref:Response regulatory domain-containing protein n=1 Tax=Pyrodinium bahamense TaxID=73915 RepID=A0A7S0AAW0_9DINO|mmetsp:Transcript_29518/g.81079  ORF Transcript_29518/g.81079 Transcript_29518/m.81079 type:complete len:148 (+) Transcript_29518:114-557(+)